MDLLTFVQLRIYEDNGSDEVQKHLEQLAQDVSEREAFYKLLLEKPSEWDVYQLRSIFDVFDALTEEQPGLVADGYDVLQQLVFANQNYYSVCSYYPIRILHKLDKQRDLFAEFVVWMTPENLFSLEACVAGLYCTYSFEAASPQTQRIFCKKLCIGLQLHNEGDGTLNRLIRDFVLPSLQKPEYREMHQQLLPYLT